MSFSSPSFHHHPPSVLFKRRPVQFEVEDSGSPLRVLYKHRCPPLTRPTLQMYREEGRGPGRKGGGRKKQTMKERREKRKRRKKTLTLDSHKYTSPFFTSIFKFCVLSLLFTGSHSKVPPSSRSYSTPLPTEKTSNGNRQKQTGPN